jgi:hypothetical protein
MRQRQKDETQPLKRKSIMAGQRGKHMLTVYANIPSDIEDDFNNWYNTQHIPERLAIQGFQSAARYETFDAEHLGARMRDAAKTAPKYLALYELDDASILESPAYQALRERNQANAWDQRILPKLQVQARTVYEQILACGEASEAHAPFLLSVRIEVTPEVEDEFNEWYNVEHLPSLSAVPGVQAARRYRKLSGNGQKYLALYELDNARVMDTEAWGQAANTDWTKKMRPHIGQHMAISLRKRIF